MIGDLPTADGPPPARQMGQIDVDDVVIEKWVFESFPGYVVPALLYKPKTLGSRAPAVLGPCGHSAIGKADDDYQIFHQNLARRGYVVLSYDPVGQGERSQFWDPARHRSRFDLRCQEHAVLGNPLYLMGENLARYRIWDGIRAIDYLASRADVDPKRIACAGVSGGGTLTAYLAALDLRITVTAICCYLTTLPRRMATRARVDPDADPEQDPFGFVSEGIDHAGLLALCAPRPTLVGAARLDFFPIEGTRQSFAEARSLFAVAGDVEKLQMIEAQERHGLTRPIREAIYHWFGRWLSDGTAGPAASEEIAVRPRPARELEVCPDGQVSLSLGSRALMPIAWKAFTQRLRPVRMTLRALLDLDPQSAHPLITELNPVDGGHQILVICLNGSESPDWQEHEPAFLRSIAQAGHAVAIVDPRGVGRQRPDLPLMGHDYADPLVGVEENIAYNAFLVGRTLAGMRVADLLAAMRTLVARARPRRMVIVGRRDAAWIACLAAAIEPTIDAVALEAMPLAFDLLFTADAQPINSASVISNLLRDFGEVSDVLAEIAPRPVLLAACTGTLRHRTSVQQIDAPLVQSPDLLMKWLER